MPRRDQVESKKLTVELFSWTKLVRCHYRFRRNCSGFSRIRSLERLGSSKTRKVDVRIITATNRDLATATTSGEFRQDLHYRLNVFPIRVPPLRERREDAHRYVEFFHSIPCKRIWIGTSFFHPRPLRL